MNLVKWMRDNNHKLMIFVVLFIMVGFVGGAALTQLLARLGTGSGTIATYYDSAINYNDRNVAQQELEVLKQLQVPNYLYSFGGDYLFSTKLLGQVLFPDTQSAAQLNATMKQFVSYGRYPADIAKIDLFFEEIGGISDINWILLNAEAKRAGCVTDRQRSSKMLANNISMMTQGRATAGNFVNSIGSRLRLTEDQILDVYGKLLAVMDYANMTTNIENVTLSQIQATAGLNGETIDSEFVRFSAESLVDSQTEPTEEELAKQFAAYKDFNAGQISDENPYGFGYVQPDRVQLEYIILKSREVAKIIESVTAEEMENYYQQNSHEFTEQIKADPTDAESVAETKTKPFAEVIDQIRGIIQRTKTTTKADVIFSEATDEVESAFDGIDKKTVTVDELKGEAADYGKIAASLSLKYNISVYSGTTGELNLSVLDDRKSELGGLTVPGQSQSVRLSKIVFGVDELGVTKLGRFEIDQPKMWDNIIHLTDRSKTTWAIVRVVDTFKSSAPESLSLTYKTTLSSTGIRRLPQTVYTLKDDVASDVKKLKAMEAAKKLADEFANTLAGKSWDDAVVAFNKTGADGDKKRENFLKASIQSLTKKSRLSLSEKSNMTMLAKSNPLMASYVDRMVMDGALTEKLHSLIPAGELEISDAKIVFGFEPAASYYVVKSISKQPVSEQDLAKQKQNIIMGASLVGGDTGALIHYRPDNIITRTGFEWAKEVEEETEEAESDKETSEK